MAEPDNVKHLPLVQSEDNDNVSSSLVATAGLYMATIISLALMSMIFSILVTEKLAGGAELINNTGSLRMQVIRISRAQFLETGSANHLIGEEKKAFETKLFKLKQTTLGTSFNTPEIEKQYQQIVSQWQQLNSAPKAALPEDYDQFTSKLDNLVHLIQLESEKKLTLLRLIQSIAVLLILVISTIALIKINQLLAAPLKNLVHVAEEAGKGNFSAPIEFEADNELGLLAKTIKRMSSQLAYTYQDYEQIVAEKTRELTRSNESLEVLYKGARLLSNQEYDRVKSVIIQDMQALIGIGTIKIRLIHKHIDNLVVFQAGESGHPSNYKHSYQFSLEKHNKVFGDIIWEVPEGQSVEDWQKQLIQAMADIVATAIELGHQKNAENRLLISEERAIIARELHDSLAQSLSFLKVQMSLLTRKMEKKLPEEQIEETIVEIKSGLNKAYLQLRELLTTFRLKLDDPSIESALQGTIAEFTQKCQHPIRFSYDLPQHCLSANQEIHLLQIIREGLSNIHRHAKASEAGVRLSPKGELIKLDIWDNGAGLPGTLQTQGHFGLGIMRERVSSLKGQMYLKDHLPSGTMISITFEN
ncbi:histidine kinase [Shewanella halifaxensis HAW-EB4]|uniref:Sensor protein n=1 Tax=Shewanella halifaxensis (strain HAW-EB4) TaxID=458817 RepID=B0TN39_SHEHH|nr:histidine kinase [Shewanella halifaxensis]ABZ74751.1 histidine kinase [Shewanella halifaxensis HAW-EB4]